MCRTKYLIGFLLLTITISQAQWVQSKLGLPTSWNTGWALDSYNDTTVVISINVGAFTPGWLYKTTNSGKKWGVLPTSELSIIDISMVDPQHMWIVTGYGKLLASTNGGADWTIQFEDTSKTKFFNFIRMFDLQNGIAMGDGKKGDGSDAALFLKTTDGGTHWISMNDSVFGGNSGDTWKRLSFIDQNIGYFYESGVNPQNMFKTTDGGVSWKATNLGPGCEVLQFYNASIGLVYNRFINGPKIRRTLDGGVTWETFDAPFDGWGNDIEFIKGDPSQVWATAGSLFYSNDTGRTWTKQLQTNGRDIAFFGPSRGWILSDSGVYHTTTGPLVSVSEHKGIIPEQLSLEQNYPNPFNPTTAISYQLPTRNFVSLKVYDAIGREVATLVNEVKDAGFYTVTFSAMSGTASGGNAQKLASGLYYYTLRAGNFLQTKKMVLIK